tara:strand:- start:121 stop:333 length:213 start_codon:yes stop_codon:yes gene_type:complete
VKITSFIFLIIRSTLGLFGLGKGNCMYYPTCSSVINEEINKRGIFKTLPLVFYRIYTCNPIYRKFGKNWQ